jgi:NAD(P)-dependent dehydrogenase (short-subunit alcohol dehydrogenase family)
MMSKKGAVLVTGGAKRIGRAIALALAGRGYSIAVHYGSSEGDARELQAKIEAMNVRCRLFECDLADMRKVASLIPAVLERFPDLEILVNNASVFVPKRFLETKEDFFDRLFTVNFKAPFFLTRDFALHVKRGQIINLLDTKITKNLREHFVYALTKKALADFTRMAARELAPAIRVNGVSPGLILSPPGEDQGYLERAGKKIPMECFGSPEQIASAVCFLIESPFITGEIVFVDGGEHLI